MTHSSEHIEALPRDERGISLVRAIVAELSGPLEESRQRALQLRTQATELLTLAAECEQEIAREEEKQVATLRDLLVGRKVTVSGVPSVEEGVDLSDSATPFWRYASGYIFGENRKIVGVSKGNALNRGQIGALENGIFLTVEELNRNFGGRGHRTQLHLGAISQLDFDDDSPL